MAIGEISEISLNRTPLPPVGEISEMSLSRTPPPPPDRVGEISAMWITRGYTPPTGNGGRWISFDGETWTRYRERVVHEIGTWS